MIATYKTLLFFLRIGAFHANSPNVRHERRPKGEAFWTSARWRGYASPATRRRLAAQHRPLLTSAALALHHAGRSASAKGLERSRSPGSAPPWLTALASESVQTSADSATPQDRSGAARASKNAGPAHSRAAEFVWPERPSTNCRTKTVLRTACAAARLAQAPRSPRSCAAPRQLRLACASLQ